ncbi:Hpt domain-containing protein [Arthrobacter sp. LjRoot14]|uniref:Hpt domain-containing protein n=1 Tax=Arthrobacter sp. LjRoot14 TaxID=3342265 RepID=UPI003ECC8BDD
MSSSAPDPGAPSSDRADARSRDGQQPRIPRPGGEELPLVDWAVLAELEEELGSPVIAWNFARDYTLIWRRRQRALASALEQREQHQALDAVISLRVSAAMIGGMRLAQLAQTLQLLIQEGDLEGGEALLGRVDDYGSGTTRELQRSYLLTTD